MKNAASCIHICRTSETISECQINYRKTVYSRKASSRRPRASEFIISLRARWSREPRVVLARCKIRCAINVPIFLWIYAWCPPMPNVMENFAFPGNIDFAADDRRIFMYYPWKAHVFSFMNIHLCNNAYNRWITSTTSGWKSPIFNRNSSGERRLKFVASGEDDDDKKPRAKHGEHRLAQRRQRRQHSDHKHLQRQWQNTTITLQIEPMKRGNTDCRRFKKRWGDQATLTVYMMIYSSKHVKSAF